MRNSLYLYLIVLSILPYPLLAQEPVSITPPELELKDNRIIITYDILNSTRRDLFDIWIEVTDTAGNKIDANTLTGDVGEEVKGGTHRVISWDLAADGIFLDAGIYVQVYGERLTPTLSEQFQMTELRVNPYKAIGQSILFPGLGLSKLMKPKIHMAKGFLAYGSVAAAVSLNWAGHSNYTEYLENPDLTTEENIALLKKSQNQKTWSVTLGYAAVGIWLTDMAWTYISASRILKAEQAGQLGQIRMQFNYDTTWQAPVLGLRYTF